MNAAAVVSGDHPRVGGHNVFLSYSTADRERAELVARAFERVGLRVIHPDQAALGQDIYAGIVKAIDESDVVAFLVSDASPSSSWVGSELAYAMAVRLHGGRLMVVPIMLDKGAELPALLRGLQFFDLSDPSAFDQNVERLAELLSANETPAASPLDEQRLAEALDLRRRSLELEITEYERAVEIRRERLAAFARSFAASALVAGVVAMGILTSFFTNAEGNGGLVGIVVAVTSLFSAAGGIYVGRFSRTLNGLRRRSDGER